MHLCCLHRHATEAHQLLLFLISFSLTVLEKMRKDLTEDENAPICTYNSLSQNFG